MKRPDLLLPIAIWQFITALGALIVISVIGTLAFPSAISHNLGSATPGVIFGLGVAILLLLCYIGLAMVGGAGLLQGKEWGRILCMAHATLSLFCIPVGTVIGLLSIIYLSRPEVSDYINASSGKRRV